MHGILSLVVVLTLCGSSIAMSIASLLQFSPTPFSVIMRLIIVCLSIIVIIVGVMKNRSIKITSLSLLLFWMLYTYRILTDMFVYDISWGKSNILILGFVFGNSLLPILAITIYGKFIDIKKMMKIFHNVLFISCLLLVYVAYFNIGGFNNELFNGRNSFGYETLDGNNVKIINPILVSLLGGVFSLLNLCKVLFTRNASFNKLYYIIGLSIGLVLMLMGASRGPIIAFGICLLFIIMIFFYQILFLKKNISYKFFSTFFLLSSIIGGVLFLINTQMKITIIYRFKVWLSNISQGIEDKRNVLVESALTEFYQSPILGHHYICIAEMWNPHNLYVEILMATGIIGMFLFLISIFSYFSGTMYSIIKSRNNMLTIQMLLLFLFLCQTTSGSIMDPKYWAIFALTLAVPVKNYQ